MRIAYTLSDDEITTAISEFIAAKGISFDANTADLNIDCKIDGTFEATLSVDIQIKPTNKAEVTLVKPRQKRNTSPKEVNVPTEADIEEVPAQAINEETEPADESAVDPVDPKPVAPPLDLSSDEAVVPKSAKSLFSM